MRSTFPQPAPPRATALHSSLALAGHAAQPAPTAGASAKTAAYLTNTEAAEFLRLSPRTLEKQRVIGGGPRFHKFGRRVMYACTDLQAWADARSFGATCDPEYISAVHGGSGGPGHDR